MCKEEEKMSKWYDYDDISLDFKSYSLSLSLSKLLMIMVLYNKQVVIE